MPDKRAEQPPAEGDIQAPKVPAGGCRRCGGDVYASGCPRCGGTGVDPDREPQPSDGPDYHAEHAAWRERNGR